jgi:hypothetical protein
MGSALQPLSRPCRAAAVAGLCVAWLSSTLPAVTAGLGPSAGLKDPKQALAASTTAVKPASTVQPAASKTDARSPANSTPVAAAAARSSAQAAPGLAPTPRPSFAAAGAQVSALGPDFIWVPEPAGPQLRRQVTGGERTERTTYTHSRTGKPVSKLTIEKGEPPPVEVDDRARPRVWCVPASEHVSPINGNLLRDGHLGYENGSLMLGHHISNEIWNAHDKTVRVTCDSNWAASFQLITELEGKQRRIQILADDLDGPRILPAGPCIKLSRLWYVRGKHGREVDGWWDEPLTLIPLLRPLNVPPPDNNVIGQTNQSFFVNIHIPRRVFAGTYRTALHVTDLDDPLYEEDVRVEVTARPTGARSQ